MVASRSAVVAAVSGTAVRSKVLGAVTVAALLTTVGCASSSSPAPATAAASTASITAATPGTAAARAAVSGSARLSYAYSPDDDIRFGFELEAVPFSRPTSETPQGLPTDARGTVRISHHVASLGRAITSEAEVDCLVTGDRSATFTAIITRADPELADTVGQRRGFSVFDGGSPEHPDRVGFSWGVANLDLDSAGKAVEGRVGTCMAPAPFAPVVTGDLTVRHTELPPLPTATTTATAAPGGTPAPSTTPAAR
ncbi:hypothetical protein ACWGB8_04080 [Kitasatospora sp. NPDC054939]